MTAIILRDHVILAPQTILPPYTLNMSNRLCGFNRDFLALDSGTIVNAEELENLDANIGSRSHNVNQIQQNRRCSYHVLHISGRCYSISADSPNLETSDTAVFDIRRMGETDVSTYGAESGCDKFIRGVVQGVRDPHEIMRLVSKMWPDFMPCYSVVPTHLLLEWMKSASSKWIESERKDVHQEWPFKIYPDGSYTEWAPATPTLLKPYANRYRKGNTK